MQNRPLSVPRWKRVAQKTISIVAAVTMLFNFGGSVFLLPKAAEAKVTPPTTVTNPPLGQSCGLDIGLVIDSSGSIDNTELTQMKNAFKGFVDAFLPGTPTEFSVNEFDTNVVGTTLAFTDSIANIKARINSASSGGYTNWEAGLYNMHNQYDPRAAKPDLIVFASDGNPNTTGVNGNSSAGAAGETAAVAAAVTRANAIKNDGIRIIALGIGNDLDVNNLKAISGNNVATSAAQITTSSDVITADFSTLATTLSELAGELCGGKILVQKQIDTNGDGIADIDGSNPDAQLAGWEFDVNGTPTNPTAEITTNTGSLEFEVENGTYSVIENTTKPTMHLSSAVCTNAGQTVGTFDAQTRTVSGLTMNTDETISCTFVNSANTYKLRVKKNVDVNGDGDVNDANEYHVTNWTYDVDGGNQNYLTDYTWHTFVGGAHSISEDQKAGFHVTDLTCDNGQSFGAVESATINLTSDTTCVFTNAISTGKIYGYKFNDLNRNGVWNQPSEPAMAGVTINLTGDANQSDITDGNGYYEFSDLLPGDYTVSEVVPTDWVITTQNNVDVALVAGQDSRVDFGNRATECKFTIEKDGPATVDVNGNITYTITYHNEGDGWCIGGGVKVTDEIPEYTSYVSHNPLESGSFDGEKVVWNLGNVAPNGAGVLTLVVKAEDKGADICGDWEVNNIASFWAKDKITNAVQTGSDDHTTTVHKDCEGTLIVKKHVVGGTSVASDWTMYVAGPENANFAGSEAGVSDIYPAGNYVVTESATPADYTLAYSGDCDAQGNVTVEHNKTKICVLTNTRDTGSIEVHKAYDYNNDGIVDETDPASWTWNLDGIENGITAGATRDLLANVSYTVSENADAEYNSSWMCDNGQSGLGTQTDSISVSKGEHVICTFNNIRKFGDVTFEKVVVGGDASASDWTFEVDGKTYNHGETVAIPTGTYAVTENGPQGYTNTNISGICSPAAAAAGGTLVVTENGGTCTFTNTRDTGRIIVNKNVDTDGDGDIDVTGATDWTWDLSGVQQDIATGSGVGVDSGTYTIHEDQKSGFHVTDLTCDNQSYGAVESENIPVAKDQVVTCTFTNTRDTGTLRIKKYEDVNANGAKNDGESYLTGWEFTVTQGDTVIGTYATGQHPVGTDWILVTGLPTGDYTVTETLQTGWTNTTPLTQSATVSYGQTETRYFGNFEQGKIWGYKWNDVDQSGNFTNGDYVLPNWTICLDLETDICTQTDANGRYEFTNLNPGTYTVYETVLPGWMAVFPTTNQQVIVSTSGQVTQADFFNFKYGKISGYKFEDTNGNGIWENGEPALSDWTINLSGADTDSDATDANGKYEFDELQAGTYGISETQQDGWMQTTQNPADVTVVSGTNSENNNFGNFNKVDIQVCKVEDLDGNVQTTDDQSAVYGWQMTLTKNGQTFDQKTTDEGGCATWEDLGPGSYSVTEETSAGWTALTPTTHDFGTVLSGQEYGYTFVNFEYGKISGYKHDDHGVALPNWEICINRGGVVVANTTLDRQVEHTQPVCVLTDANGYYEFTGLYAGSYTVFETLQNGWTQLSPNDPEYHTVVVTSGTDATENNFVNRKNEFEVEIIKSAPATVLAGDTMTYTLDWAITGNTEVFDAVIHDALPAHTSFVSASHGGTYDSNTGTITWDLGDITPNQSGQVTFIVQVSSPLDKGTEIYNDAQICGAGDIVQNETYSSLGQDITPGMPVKCDDDNTTTTVESTPILGLVKSNDKENTTVSPTETINYTILWSVDGNSKATNVTLVDSIPTEITVNVASISNGGVYDTATRTITWDLGTQIPHAEGSVTYSATVNTPAADGTVIHNVAKLSSDETDPEFVEDDSDTTIVSDPVLGIEKTVNIGNNLGYVNPGDTVTYTVVVSNTGTDTAYNTTLADTLPDGFLFADSLTPAKVFALGDIAVGGSVTTTYDVIVGTNVKAGTYDNLAVAQADNHGPVDDTVAVEVRVPTPEGDTTEPILTIEKTVNVQFANPGDTIEYTVVISNSGDGQALDVTLTDTLPTGFTFDNGAQTKTWNIGSIDVGAHVSVTYNVAVGKDVKAGEYENLAIAQASNHDAIQDRAVVEIKIPRVLGDSVPNTGVSPRDFVIFLSSILLMIAGALFIHEGRKKNDEIS